MCLGVAKPSVYTSVELYLNINDINCLHCVFRVGTGEPITCSHG